MRLRRAALAVHYTGSLMTAIGLVVLSLSLLNLLRCMTVRRCAAIACQSVGRGFATRRALARGYATRIQRIGRGYNARARVAGMKHELEITEESRFKNEQILVTARSVVDVEERIASFGTRVGAALIEAHRSRLADSAAMYVIDQVDHRDIRELLSSMLELVDVERRTFLDAAQVQFALEECCIPVPARAIMADVGRLMDYCTEPFVHCADVVGWLERQPFDFLDSGVYRDIQRKVVPRLADAPAAPTDGTAHADAPLSIAVQRPPAGAPAAAAAAAAGDTNVALAGPGVVSVRLNVPAASGPAAVVAPTPPAGLVLKPPKKVFAVAKGFRAAPTTEKERAEAAAAAADADLNRAAADHHWLESLDLPLRHLQLDRRRLRLKLKIEHDPSFGMKFVELSKRYARPAAICVRVFWGAVAIAFANGGAQVPARRGARGGREQAPRGVPRQVPAAVRVRRLREDVRVRAAVGRAHGRGMRPDVRARAVTGAGGHDVHARVKRLRVRAVPVWGHLMLCTHTTEVCAALRQLLQ